MKRVMIFFAFVALALVPFSGCAVTMEKRMPFYASALENYNIEEQVLIPGITEESFQISVPRNGEIDQFELRDGVFDRYSVTLPDFKILTSHYNRPVGDRLFLSERSALFILTSDGSKILWEKHFSLYEPTGGFFQGQNGALYATGEGGGKQSKFEVYRISEETGVERTFQLPFSFGAFPIWKLPTKDGIVTYWAGPIGKVKEMAQFFTWEGEEKPHPLVKAFNVLAASQVHISGSTSGLFPRGAVLSRTKDAWGVLPDLKVDRFPGADLFLLSALNDSTHLQPIVLEPKAAHLKNDVSFLLAHPSLNLALIGIKRQDETSLYLIHVRVGEKFCNPTVYRLSPFPEVQWPVLSHNGNVFAFAMREHGETKIVMSRLEDILSDINRRYPEAKLSLAALESEVK